MCQEDELEEFTPSSEMEVVYTYNNFPEKRKPVYCMDPINTFNIKGEMVGYT